MNITAKGEAKLPILERRWKSTNFILDILNEIKQVLCKSISRRFLNFKFDNEAIGEPIANRGVNKTRFNPCIPAGQNFIKTGI